MSARIELGEVDVGGVRIAFRRAGDRPALVLLHGGLGLDSRDWRHQLDALSEEFGVVAWDMPGAAGPRIRQHFSALVITPIAWLAS